MQNRQYYVTATVDSRKIFISTKDIQNAFEVERSLLNCQTEKIMNIRHGKHRPKSSKKYIEISGIEELENI